MPNLPPLSPGSSSTPCDLLELEPSLIARAGRGLLALVLVLGCLSLARAQGVLAAGLLLGYWTLVPGCWRSPGVAAIARSRGRWFLLLCPGGWQRAQLLPGTQCLPWLVYLRWRAAGRRGVLLLWPDSASPEALRRLRKQLAGAARVG